MRPITRLLVLLFAFLCVPAYANDWAQWRGPEQNGVSRETGLPTTWNPDTGENVVWKNNVGGMSSPIVMNGHVYTITRVGEQQAPDTLIPGPKTQEAVICVDAETGKTVWEYRENPTQTEVPFHRLGWGNVVGDPETGRIYAYMIHASLVCLDGKDGKLIWKRQMTEEFGQISTFGGRTPSPTIDEDQVFISGVAFGWGDNARSAHRVFALDKNTGALNWTSPTGGSPVDAPYSPPTIAVINGERIVITVAGDGGVHAFQSRTGKKLWSYILSKRGLNSSPLVNGNFVYACSSEENVDTAQMGRVVCLDASQIENGAPKEVWRQDRIEAGFASPTFFDDRLYVFDNSATVYAMDAKTGQVQWKRRAGTIGKASLVFADNKLYVGEANGRFHIWEVGPKSAKPLSTHYLGEKMGREYAIYGSVAISNGRVYLQAANTMYCIGPKEAKKVDVPVPGLPQEAPVGENTQVAHIQVRPADLLLKQGQKATFTAHAFTAKGQPAGTVKDAKWSIGQLQPQLPPARPGAPAPTTLPAKIGNLKGEVTQNGEFTSAPGGHQGGGIFVTSGNVTGYARVRVLPPLPWKLDFEPAMIGTPPITWLGAGGKFAVEEKAGSKVLTKLLNLDLYYRARTNFGFVNMSNYTLSADVNVGEKVQNNERYMPDPGLINSRYVLTLLGNHQRLQIHTWPSALPHSLNQTIPFQWSSNTWYRMKLRVDQESGKAMVRGKVWKRDEPEPEAWNVQMEDTLPNTHGNPGIFGHSLVTPYKSEIYYDNIEVTENK